MGFDNWGTPPCPAGQNLSQGLEGADAIGVTSYEVLVGANCVGLTDHTWGYTVPSARGAHGRASRAGGGGTSLTPSEAWSATGLS